MATKPQDLIDLAYYNAQAGQAFTNTDAAYAHMLSFSLETSPAINPFFEPEWYVWQNPDVQGYPSILDHFWTVGDRRIIDPGPFVDLTLFCRKHGFKTSRGGLAALRQIETPTAQEGVHPDFASLQKHQTAFLDKIAPEHLIDRRGAQRAPRKRLLWIQIGRGSEFAKWFDRAAPRQWDLLANWYDFSAIDLSLSEIALAQRGTKFTAVAKTLAHFPDLFDPYDHILFLDDDLIFDFDQIDRLFDLAEKNEADLFQAGLTPNSHCIWPVIKEQSSKELRLLNTVEIMMPGFSRKGFKTIQHVFKESVSGFGLDLAMGAIAKEAGLKTGIIDPIRAQHLKPINQSEGAYYEYLRAAGINSKLELWHLMQAYGTERDIKAV